MSSDHSPAVRRAFGSDDGEVSDSDNDRRAVAEGRTLSFRPPKTRKDTESDSSGPDKKHKERRKKHKHHKEKHEGASPSEEERLRRSLLEKRKEKKKPKEDENAGEDEEELLTIQPIGQQSLKNASKVEAERSHDRDREERSRDRSRDRSRHAPAKDFSRDRYGRPSERSDRRNDRYRHGYRDNKQARPFKDERDRKHRRSRSRSRSPDRKKERKDERSSKDKKEISKKDKAKEKTDNENSRDSSVERKLEDVEMVKETTVLEVIEIVKDEDVNMIEETTHEDDDQGPSDMHSPPSVAPHKYSKFDSSPEMSEPPDHPMTDIDEDESDQENQSDAESVVSDVNPDALYEEMTEEQKLRLSPDSRKKAESEWQKRLISRLPIYYPGISGCRHAAEFDCLNRIEEGTFGVVYRAMDKRTEEIVALKRLKMEKEKEGFPITSLREVNMLLKAGGHENIVNVKEIVIGSDFDKIYLVMEYVEHDMKSLMEMMHRRGKKFTSGEAKTLMRQLLSGMRFMHDLWILHRDLKTSNLLMSHKGILKIGDFGLAREYGSPLRPYTPIVVTLWYRSPELLLGIKEYSTAVDMWSVGCIMAEFLLLKPLFTGKDEADQVNKIFTELGSPSEKIWNGYDKLPLPKQVVFPHHAFNQLRKKFPASLLTENGFKLLNRFLTYDPEKRISAADAMGNAWFTEDPVPTPPEMFPTWPAKSELGKQPPVDPKIKAEKAAAAQKAPPAFALKFDVPKF